VHGLEKYAKISVQRGKVQRKEHVEYTELNEIKELERIRHTDIWE
jgi:hypothetical protein